MTRLVALGDIAELNPGVASELRAADHDMLVPFLPMAAVSEEGRAIYTEHRTLGSVLKGFTCFAKGDVILAKITPCFENGKAAYLHDLPSDVGFGSTEFHVLRPGPDVDGSYLFHAVWNSAFRLRGEANMTGTAGQKRVPTSYVRSAKIPLPPLAEQRRIAEVLDRVEGVRGLRRQSLSELQALRRTVFLHAIGDAHADYHTWPEHRIEELVAPESTSLKTGPFGSALRHSEFVDSGVAVLGIDNVVANEFRWDERRYITPEKYSELTRYTVRPGDVLVTLMGTIGRSAVVPDDCPVAVSTKHLAVISVDQTRVLPLFLSSAIHSSPSIARQLGTATRGAIMPALNLGIIKSLRLRVPPLELQVRFVEVLARIARIERHAAHSALSLDGLYGGVASRAVGGRT